jgi:hypothetical protein
MIAARADGEGRHGPTFLALSELIVITGIYGESRIIQADRTRIVVYAHAYTCQYGATL